MGKLNDPGSLCRRGGLEPHPDSGSAPQVLQGPSRMPMRRHDPWPLSGSPQDSRLPPPDHMPSSCPAQPSVLRNKRRTLQPDASEKQLGQAGGSTAPPAHLWVAQSRLGLGTTGRQDGQGPPVLFILTNSGRGTPEPNTSLSLEGLTHHGLGQFPSSAQHSDMLHHPAQPGPRLPRWEGKTTAV